MRRAMDNVTVFHENEKVIGICLGYDHCAEHEWGIKKLKEDFGISTDEKLWGIPKRKISKIPKPGIIFEEKGKYSVLVCENYEHRVQEILECFEKSKDLLKSVQTLHMELNIYGPWKKDIPDKPSFHIGTAWDESSFGIIVDEKYQKELKEIYDAMMNMDCVIFLAGNTNPFGGGGLCIFIESRINEKDRKMCYDGDADVYAIRQKHIKSGIEEVLKKAGKRWFALSPRWLNDKKEELMWWLNPQDQKNVQYGWYTYQDLIDWSNNTGKVLILKENKK